MDDYPFVPKVNAILSALPAEDYERLSPQLERVELQHRHIIYDAGAKIDYVYFPLNLMNSLVTFFADGTSVEVGVIGYEGMVGIPLVLGVARTSNVAMVQLPGEALRMKAENVLAEFKRGGALHDLLLRYTQAQMMQTSQAAACNRLHSTEERLARWLLMCHDRSFNDELTLTREFLGMMIGERQTGVSTVALALQAEGFINYRRGWIKIVDRTGLEDFACECYGIIKAEFDRLLTDFRPMAE